MALQKTQKGIYAPSAANITLRCSSSSLTEGILIPFTTYSLVYACPRSGCFICYASSTGYFTIDEGEQSKRAEVPQVSCPQDCQPMYLAEVHPQKTSLRLWKCGNAKCQGYRTIEEFVFEPDDPFVEQYFRMNP